MNASKFKSKTISILFLNLGDLFYSNYFSDKNFLRTIWDFETMTIASLTWLSRLKTIILLQFSNKEKSDILKMGSWRQFNLLRLFNRGNFRFIRKVAAKLSIFRCMKNARNETKTFIILKHILSRRVQYWYVE